jgi:hypothetical protein
MSTSFGRGLHAAPGRAVSISAYDGYLGRWSRLSVPDVLAAAGIARGHRVLDVASGTGEAALMAIPVVGETGFAILPQSSRRPGGVPPCRPSGRDGSGLRQRHIGPITHVGQSR